jgi:hypothetical protein
MYSISKKGTSNKGNKKGILSKKGTFKKAISSNKGTSSKSLEKGCEETKCTKYVKEGLEFTEEFMTEGIKASKKNMLEEPDLEKRKRAKISVKALLNAKKEMSGPSYLNKEMQICKKLYCNPTCAETTVNGVVEDGFNKKLDPKDVKKLKREGAISG